MANAKDNSLIVYSGQANTACSRFAHKAFNSDCFDSPSKDQQYIIAFANQCSNDILTILDNIYDEAYKQGLSDSNSSGNDNTTPPTP